MRHALLVLLAAVGVAIVLVLALGEDEVGEDTAPNTAGSPTATRDTRATPPVSPPVGDRSRDRPRRGSSREEVRIERVVARYVERAETGQVDAPGLPTTDELAIEGVYLSRRKAKVALVGGAQLSLRKAAGRWRVVSASVPDPEPTPPSNG